VLSLPQERRLGVWRCFAVLEQASGKLFADWRLGQGNRFGGAGGLAVLRVREIGTFPDGNPVFTDRNLTATVMAARAGSAT
jgi:hypothetical protein